MSILIKGLEMPRTHPITVEIYPNGTVLSKTVGSMDIHGKAVPVPPHGDLIDRDALNYEYDEDSHEWGYDIFSTPTIIPAEDGE